MAWYQWTTYICLNGKIRYNKNNWFGNVVHYGIDSSLYVVVILYIFITKFSI